MGGAARTRVDRGPPHGITPVDGDISDPSSNVYLRWYKWTLATGLQFSLAFKQGAVKSLMGHLNAE